MPQLLLLPSSLASPSHIMQEGNHHHSRQVVGPSTTALTLDKHSVLHQLLGTRREFPPPQTILEIDCTEVLPPPSTCNPEARAPPQQGEAMDKTAQSRESLVTKTCTYVSSLVTVWYLELLQPKRRSRLQDKNLVLSSSLRFKTFKTHHEWVLSAITISLPVLECLASKRCQNLPLYPTETKPSGYKMDLPLGMAEPIKNGGSASEIFQKGKEVIVQKQLQSEKTGERISERIKTARLVKKEEDEVFQMLEQRFPCSLW
ncbi:hypothetical protein BTVI_10987 [Pitangus sulphuratus]|nr:hypothetical protein BTVI_10987 [Pitangus sulphuratus]